ncbi:hypothetical protein ONZ45_g19058 [Pleurotus djamor]|nr:hypothetical protein ONZ45_g19058 [Pleurotus djamor]
MSVATKNPFALLDDADNSRPSTPPPKAQEAPAPAATRGQQKSRGGPASRGGKYYNRGGARATPKDANGVDEVPGEGQRRADGENRGRGRGRGRGGNRGGRGRQYDRHSATGKTDSDKKVHQGWGGDDGNTELKAEEAATQDEWGTPDTGAPAAEGDAADKGAAGGDKEGRPRKEREVEEEDNTLTLEQYRAQQKDLAGVPKLETRKANDGAEGDIWKDAVPLTKGESEDAYFVGKTKSAPKARGPKAEKVFLEIDAHFDRPDRGGRGRGRGDRGRGGRGGGRGGPRGGRNTNNAQTVNVDDEAAFPSLA